MARHRCAAVDIAARAIDQAAWPRASRLRPGRVRRVVNLCSTRTRSAPWRWRAFARLRFVDVHGPKPYPSRTPTDPLAVMFLPSTSSSVADSARSSVPSRSPELHRGALRRRGPRHLYSATT
jgi:hypothetical protein